MGTNGIFEVKPVALNFAGFAVRQTQTRKILVKNVSSGTQRVGILPTSTPYFSVKYNKRGMLAPGMSEVLLVQFTPPEWRYYYDCIRILSPGGNLNVPVHAYPVMNDRERYLPSLLDIGKCIIGEKLQRTLELECTVPVSFEYEIKTVQGHPDIYIGPVSGDIPGNSVTQLEVCYEPHSAVTAIAIIEFRLSEFDFTPIPVSYTHLTLPTNREV